ncbi:hypothetical protein NFI96_001211 [Prochilodus magdalenae]|nr:hypothetical protein NFI96_001211 [Prochilodus magdalenae]
MSYLTQNRTPLMFQRMEPSPNQDGGQGINGLTDLPPDTVNNLPVDSGLMDSQSWVTPRAQEMYHKSASENWNSDRPYDDHHDNRHNPQLEHPHTVPADGAVGVEVEVEGHQVFWTRDNRPFILVLTTVPPHTDSLGVSTKTKAGLVTEDDPLPF